MSEFLVVSSTFARQPLWAIPLVAGLLIAFGALMLRLHSVAFGEPKGSTCGDAVQRALRVDDGMTARALENAQERGGTAGALSTVNPDDLRLLGPVPTGPSTAMGECLGPN